MKHLKPESCSRKHSTISHLFYIWNQDGQIAQCKFVDPDCESMTKWQCFTGFLCSKRSIDQIEATAFCTLVLLVAIHDSRFLQSMENQWEIWFLVWSVLLGGQKCSEKATSFKKHSVITTYVFCLWVVLLVVTGEHNSAGAQLDVQWHRARWCRSLGESSPRMLIDQHNCINDHDRVQLLNDSFVFNDHLSVDILSFVLRVYFVRHIVKHLDHFSLSNRWSGVWHFTFSLLLSFWIQYSISIWSYSHLVLPAQSVNENDDNDDHDDNYPFLVCQQYPCMA